MSLVQEIIQEAKQETRIKLKRNSKRLITTLFIISSLMSMTFYVFGIPYQDSLYRQLPLFAGIPLLAMASFNAFGMTSIVLFFLMSLGKVTSSTVKNSLEQRKETKIKSYSKAIYDAFNEYGQRDFSLQIDEREEGLNHKISETKTDVNDWKKFTSELARRFSLKSLITDWRIDKLERELSGVREELRILKESKKQEEQIASEKIHVQNQSDDDTKA